MLSGIKPVDLFKDLGTTFSSLDNVASSLTVSRFYYVSIGIIIIYVFLLEIFAPDLIGDVSMKIGKNRRLKKCEKDPKTVEYIKQVLIGYTTDFASKYAKVGYIFIFGFGFSTGMPVLVVFATLSLIFLYLSTRSAFLKHSKVPFRIEISTIHTTIRAGYFAIFWRLISSLFVLSDTSIFPKDAQKNLLSVSNLSILKGFSTSSGVAALGTRIDSLSLYLLLLLIWIVCLIVHCIIFSILDFKKSKNWLQEEIKMSERYIEEDEVTNNILDHRPKIESYTLFSYSMFKNPENRILQLFFNSSLPNEEPKKIVVDIDKTKPKTVANNGDSSNDNLLKKNQVAPMTSSKEKNDNKNGQGQGNSAGRKTGEDPNNQTQMNEGGKNDKNQQNKKQAPLNIRKNPNVQMVLNQNKPIIPTNSNNRNGNMNRTNNGNSNGNPEGSNNQNPNNRNNGNPNDRNNNGNPNGNLNDRNNNGNPNGNPNDRNPNGNPNDRNNNGNNGNNMNRMNNNGNMNQNNMNNGYNNKNSPFSNNPYNNQNGNNQRPNNQGNMNNNNPYNNNNRYPPNSNMNIGMNNRPNNNINPFNNNNNMNSERNPLNNNNNRNGNNTGMNPNTNFNNSDNNGNGNNPNSSNGGKNSGNGSQNNIRNGQREEGNQNLNDRNGAPNWGNKSLIPNFMPLSQIQGINHNEVNLFGISMPKEQADF